MLCYAHVSLTLFYDFLFFLRDQQYLPPNYYNLTSSSQMKLFSAYVALIGLLLAAMKFNNEKRKSPKQLKREQSGECFESPYDNDTWNKFVSQSDILDDDDEKW